MSYENLKDIVEDVTINLFQDAEDSVSKKIQSYSKSVADSLSLSDLNLQEKALIVPSIHHGYVNCLFSERRKLKQLKKIKETKEEEFIKKYGKAGIPRYKTELLSKEDSLICNIITNIDSQKELIRYLEEICRIMSNLNFSVKNSVDMMKLTN